MKDKILIGITPTKEIEELKSKLTTERCRSSVMYKFPNSIHVSYRDKNYIRHLRLEAWEEIDSKTLRIAQMNSIKNNILEGEQISIIWD